MWLKIFRNQKMEKQNLTLEIADIIANAIKNVGHWKKEQHITHIGFNL